MTLDELRTLLRKSWTKETSADADRWTKDNPAWGQCAITALVIQDFFGGELLRGEVMMQEGPNISHYWNKLPDNSEHDFTVEQFPSGYGRILETGIRDRKYVLSFEATRKRYALLRLAVENQINPNPLFSDNTYRSCFEAAQTSQCQKMKFGCLVMYKNKAIAAAANKITDPLRHLCEPDCIRLNIQSRTESMIGAFFLIKSQTSSHIMTKSF